MRKSLVAIGAALLLAGCATAPNTIRLTDDGAGKKLVREVTIDPVMLAGLPWTEDLKRGNFVTVLGLFPSSPEAYAEWDPLRIRYQAHAVSTDGVEYPAYAVFAGIPPCAAAAVQFIFVEGLQKPTAEVKVVTLSTLLNRAYTPDGKEIKGFDAAKFQTSASYRKEFILANGVALDRLRQVTEMSRAFASWSVYNTKAGQIVTPLDQEQVKYLAGMNAQYSFLEKVIGTTRASVTPDLVATAIGIGFDLLQAASAKSQGFDHAATMSRITQGYNLAIMESLRARSAQACLDAKAVSTQRR